MFHSCNYQWIKSDLVQFNLESFYQSFVCEYRTDSRFQLFAILLANTHQYIFGYVPKKALTT